MTFNSLIKFVKNKQQLAVIVLINLVVFSIMVMFAKDELKKIDLNTLKLTISQEGNKHQALLNELNSIDLTNNVQSYNLNTQLQKLRLITLAVSDELKIDKYKSNNKGRIYAISGNKRLIFLAAYKINQAVDLGTLMAKVEQILIKGDQAVIQLQLYGVNNDQ